MIYLFVFLSGALAWFFSTLVTGGAATLLLPVLGLVLGAQLVPPVLTVASLIANPSRVALFSAHVDWHILRYLLPGTLIGAVSGGWAFTLLEARWLELLVGLFLVSTVLQYRFNQSARPFTMKTVWFFPLGLVVAGISGVIGAVGPVFNPFFLNHGTSKEALVATKSVNSLAMQVFKLMTYGSLGIINTRILGWGVLLGLGAVCGIFLARKHLVDMSDDRFRQLLYWFMPASGLLMLWKSAQSFFSG
ncbi:MAG: sulfite exporter TauE/SafE family protein [Pseudomonadales bacterium]|nr:sulfite exporter TauE/SafE family protein [Pseudomonadales bacterium]